MKLVVLILILTSLKVSKNCKEFWTSTKLKLSDSLISIKDDEVIIHASPELTQFNPYKKVPHSIFLTLDEKLQLVIKVSSLQKGAGGIARYIDAEPKPAGLISKVFGDDKWLYTKEIAYHNVFPCIGEDLFFIKSDTEICISFIVTYEGYRKKFEVFTLRSTPLTPDNNLRDPEDLKAFKLSFIQNVVTSKNKVVKRFFGHLQKEDVAKLEGFREELKSEENYLKVKGQLNLSNNTRMKKTRDELRKQRRSYQAPEAPKTEKILSLTLNAISQKNA
jgi:hypothetical protein